MQCDTAMPRLVQEGRRELSGLDLRKPQLQHCSTCVSAPEPPVTVSLQIQGCCARVSCSKTEDKIPVMAQFGVPGPLTGGPW